MPMKKATEITCAFLDVGDVLLTDGWIILLAAGCEALQTGVGRDGSRHHLTFEVFEVGRLALKSI